MKKTATFLLLLTASFGGCKHNVESPGPDPGTLAGNWRLTDRQCYCPAGQPLPDEQITFDANGHFQLFRNGALATEGSYAFSQGMSCGGSTTNVTCLPSRALRPTSTCPTVPTASKTTSWSSTSAMWPMALSSLTSASPSGFVVKKRGGVKSQLIAFNSAPFNSLLIFSSTKAPALG
jgi:hypothetical protein